MWLLGGLALVGSLVRLALAPSEPAGELGYSAPAVAVDSLAQRAELLSRPLAAGEKVDINRASAAELARLPGVGPALAARIIEYRGGSGGFASSGDLVEVPGLGPATVGRIEKYLEGWIPRDRSGRSGSASRIDINRAGVRELASLPGIGPSKARAIVEYRERHGAFAQLEDLTEVRGIGPATVERIRNRVKLP